MTTTAKSVLFYLWMWMLMLFLGAMNVWVALNMDYSPIWLVNLCAVPFAVYWSAMAMHRCRKFLRLHLTIIEIRERSLFAVERL